jgi:GNAT superfamily N-acetyltransferase
MRSDQPIYIEPLTQENFPSLERLFAAHEVTAGCWCMWFIIPVKDYHLSAADNRANLSARVATDASAMGYVAFHDGVAVGWCAAGPRERYVRAIRTPTYRPGSDDGPGIWLVPCFFIHRDYRGRGIAAQLLAAAVAGARRSGARAIDGFPFTDDKRRSGGDMQVGHATLFAGSGFTVVRQPSPARVVMRLEL